MDNQYTPNSLRKHLTRISTMEEMSLLYKANNITHEKCVLFHDFIGSLSDLIYDTYLGEDVIKDITDIEKHFDWCLDRTIANFLKENILFVKSDILNGYLLTFFYGTFYEDVNKYGSIVNTTRDFWVKTFSMSVPKTKAEVDIMVEIYKILESSIKISK